MQMRQGKRTFETAQVAGGGRAFIEFARRRHANLAALTEGLTIAVEQLASATNWIPYREVRQLHLNARKIFGDPEIAYLIGQESIRGATLGAFSSLTQSERSVYRAYRNLAQTIRALSNYGEMETIKPPGSVVTLLTRYAIEPLLGDCLLTRGAASGMTVNFGLPESKVTEDVCQVGLETILNDEYAYPGMPKLRFDKTGKVYLGDLQVGHRVLLEIEEQEDQAFSLADQLFYRRESGADALRITEDGSQGRRRLASSRVRSVPPEEVDPSDPYAAVLLTHEVVAGKPPDSVVLRANTIYNAPYCRYSITIQERPGIAHAYKSLVRRWRAKKVLDQDMLVQMEENARKTERISKLNVALEQRYEEAERARQALLQINEHLQKQVSRRGEEANEVKNKLDLSQDELEKLVKQLRNTESQLIHQAKMAGLGQLVAGVSHELRTPIQAIVSNSTNLSQVTERINKDLSNLPAELGKRLGAEAEAAAREIIASSSIGRLSKHLTNIPSTLATCAMQVNNLIHNMRQFSRTDESVKDTVAVTSLVKQTLTIAEHELRKKVDVVVELADGLPEITCSPSQLNQVLINMMMNSYQAMPDDRRGHIWLRASSPRKDWIRLEIADDGSGMPEDVRQKIFEPFFTTKPPGEGTGLGLSITHRIICEEHHGNIWVDSEVGKGTTFYIELPVGSNEVD